MTLVRPGGHYLRSSAWNSEHLAITVVNLEGNSLVPMRCDFLSLGGDSLVSILRRTVWVLWSALGPVSVATSPPWTVSSFGVGGSVSCKHHQCLGAISVGSLSVSPESRAIVEE